MTEFRRLISYIYEYEGKVKGKNVGFAKLETRNGLCKLNVSVKKLYMGSGSLGVYLLSARQEVFLGNMYLRNGGGEFRTVVQASDIEQSGESMDDCYGLTIHEKKDSWKVYTTIWEDSVAQAAQLASAPAVPEKAPERINIVAESALENISYLSESQAESKPELPTENKSEIQRENKPEVQSENPSGNPLENSSENLSEIQPENKEGVWPEDESESRLKNEAEIPSENKQETAEEFTQTGHEQPESPGEVKQAENAAEQSEKIIQVEQRLQEEKRMQASAQNRPLSGRLNPPPRRSQGQMFFNLRQPSVSPPHTASPSFTPAAAAQAPLHESLETPQPFIRRHEEEPLMIGDPEALAKLEEEEKQPMIPLWDFLSKTYPKIQAFDSQYGCEILVIKPQDIGLLPREIWIYGNNSFLLHGYYNYRYLILARLENPNGLPRYLLGIPGHYYSNEKYMASMFGFPNFVLSKKQQTQDGRFGYWYTDVRLGEGNVPSAVLRNSVSEGSKNPFAPNIIK